MTGLDFHGGYQLRIHDNSAIWENILSNDHYYFEVSDVKNPDLEVYTGDLNDIKLSSFVGSSSNCYGIIDGNFGIKNEDQAMVFDKGWKELRLTNYPPNLHRFRTIIEGEIRKGLASDGLVMVHASAVKYDSKVYAFPAWRHTGKTNTMLTLLDAGADYLGDDRVLIDSEGTIYPFPTKLHLMSYNIQAFRNSLDLGFITKLRSQIKQQVEAFLLGNKGLTYKAIGKINDIIIEPDDWVAVDNLFPTTEIPQPMSVDKLVMLRSSANNEIEVTQDGDTGYVNTLESINNSEWNEYLKNLGLVHDMFFPNRESKYEEMVKLEERESKVFKKFISNMDTSTLYLPSNQDWSDGHKDKIKEIIENT